MNAKNIVIAVAVVLAIALIAIVVHDTGQHQTDVTTITTFSNDLATAKLQISDLHDVNVTLSNDLVTAHAQEVQLSNNLATALATVAETRASLQNAQDEVTNLNQHVSELDAHVTKLEDQNTALSSQAVELTNTINHLDEVITDTQNRLSLITTNNTYLQGELQKQMAERADLEHKFNDLSAVRAQVGKLKEEIFIERRINLMKNDTGNKKGGEVLISRNPTGAVSTNNMPPNYDLNVEVSSDGSVKILPPLNGTNAAPAK